MKMLQIVASAAALSLGASAFAAPVTVDFSSTESVRGLDSFTGTAVYDSTSDKLTIDITNTSKAPLTAFAFDTEAGDKATYERAKKSPWKNEPNKKGVVNAKPFGKYDAGAAVNGTWGSLAGKKGLAAGASEVFVFDITGTNASTLTTTDFFSDTSKPEIVATFAGIRHHKPDRAGGVGHAVIADSVTPPGGSTPAPGGAPILSVTPPIVVTPPGKTVTPPATGGTGSVSAVPLPAAAPAGLAMLGMMGLVGVVRRVRARMG
jgi:hypothetical protein